MESSVSGKDRPGNIQGPGHVHGQREDSNDTTSTEAPSSAAAEDRAGASSAPPPSGTPFGEQGGGGGRDHAESSSAAAGGDRKGKNVAASSAAAEDRAGASSAPPPSGPPFGEQGGGGGRDHAESSSAAAGGDRKGKNIAATISPGSRNDGQGESPQARKPFFSKIFMSSKNEVVFREGINQFSTGSLSNRPHVAEQTIPVDQASVHYEEQILMIYRTTGKLATNAVELSQHYSKFRTVEGDGECFYRSFIFSYLEQVLDRQGTDEEQRLLRAVKEVAREYRGLTAVQEVAMEHARLGWSSNFSRSHKAFKNLVKKVMSWKTQGLLNTVATTDRYRKQKLLNFFSTYDETESIFTFLRLVAAIRICSDREQYKPYISELDENCSLQDWCSQNVTAPRALADHVQIRALATALGVHLSILQLSEGPSEDISSGGSPVCVTLLLAYNHYDIIYPKTVLHNEEIIQSSTGSLSCGLSKRPHHVADQVQERSRIRAPRHVPFTPRPRARRFRDSIDISPPKHRRAQRLSMINWQSILREWPDDADG